MTQEHPITPPPELLKHVGSTESFLRKADN
jgi:hypothetical protein